MKDRNLNHSDSWATPKYLYDQLNAEFGFDFDPCPLELGEITPENDGLLKEWGGIKFYKPSILSETKRGFCN